MIDAAEHDYITLTGILRQRIYYHWQRRVMVRAQLIDIGRADDVEPSDLELVTDDIHAPRPIGRPGRTDEVVDYLMEHGPSRPIHIAAATGLRTTALANIALRNPDLIERRRVQTDNRYGNNAVQYALRGES